MSLVASEDFARRAEHFQVQSAGHLGGRVIASPDNEDGGERGGALGLLRLSRHAQFWQAFANPYVSSSIRRLSNRLMDIQLQLYTLNL
jgi:hypothetical protein